MGLLNWLFGASTPTPGRYGKDRHKPTGIWVPTTIMVSVAGIRFRRPQAASFANAVRRAERSGARYGVRLAPEPSNPHDANAIAVYGAIDDRSWHAGYGVTMTSLDQREEPLRQIRQALDTARAIGDGMGMPAHLLEMALDEAAQSNREARQREKPRP